MDDLLRRTTTMGLGTGPLIEGTKKVDAFLESRFAPELLRVLLTGSFFGLGIAVGWLLGKWRHHVRRRQAEMGDARDVLTIEKILLERCPDGREVMRIRSCGRDPIQEVFPNEAAREEFQARAVRTSAENPLVSMEGRLGSYILQELAIWACGQVGEDDFLHDVWVMAPVSECGSLDVGGHVSTTLILVREADLAAFRELERWRAMHVEHRSHGERILTLSRLVAEFDRQAEHVERRRAEGRPSNYEETMYILDLALDTRSADLPTRPVSWERFETAKTAH